MVGAIAGLATLSSVVRWRPPDVSIAAMILAALPPSILLGFLALAARYPCRALPLRRSGVAQIIATHVISAAAAAGGWAGGREAKPKTVPSDTAPLFEDGKTPFLLAGVGCYPGFGEGAAGGAGEGAARD